MSIDKQWTVATLFPVLQARARPCVAKQLFSVQANFNYCRKKLSRKFIWINIKTKKCTPKSVLLWEFASVQLGFGVYSWLQLVDLVSRRI